MPVKQIFLLSEEGLYTQGTGVASTLAGYRYFLNGYFDKTNSTEPSRAYSFTKRPGLNLFVTSGFQSGHNIQGIISSVDGLTQIAYSNNSTSANRTYCINSGTVSDNGAAPAASGNWSYTGPVAFCRLDGISYGNTETAPTVSSITRSGSTATVTTSAPHTLVTGDNVTISGATQTEYNGTYTITVTGGSTFTYTVTGTPATPATGSPVIATEGAYYCATDFSKGAVIGANGGWHEITDADFTGLNKCTNLLGMDGYLFIGTTNNRIYNSDLNTAKTWTSTSFLTVADTPGRILWLSKIRNFLIAFKDNSIEFFEDVGNPTPGSPLEARKQLNAKIGLLHRNTIQEVAGGIIFAGVSVAGTRAIYLISKQDLSIKIISDRYLEQCLPSIKVATTTTDYSVDSRTSVGFNGESQVFTICGKEFYTINVSIPSSLSPTERFSFVYDTILEVWTHWATSLVTSGTSDTYGFEPNQAFSARNPVSTVTDTCFVDNSTTVPRILTVNNNSLVYTDLDTDASTLNNYIFMWTSDQFDFGSRKRKFMDALEVHYSSTSTTTPDTASASTLTLKYRDWDYNTTAGYLVTRTLPIDTGAGVRCIARRLGNFRKRSFSFSVNSSNSFYIWAIEVTYNQGETDQEG